MGYLNKRFRQKKSDAPSKHGLTNPKNIVWSMEQPNNYVRSMEQPNNYDLFSPKKTLHDSVNSESPDDPEASSETFQRCIAGSLCLARALGCFPLLGLLGTRPHARYRPRGALSLLSGLASLPVLWMAVTAAVFAAKTLAKAKSDTSGGVVNKMAGCIFYSNAFISATLCRGVARGWPALMRRWRAEERRASASPPLPLRVKLIAVAVVVLSLALVEHWLSILNKTWRCRADLSAGNATFTACLNEYCMKSHSFIFQIVSYNSFLGMLVVLSSEIATFLWNFQDLLLIQVSLGLVTHFKRVNSIIQKLDHQHARAAEWRAARELFSGALELARETGALLGALVLLSFTNNLFFICLQMFNGIAPGDHGIIYDLYFFGSFGFMVGRVTAVALSAAALPLEARRVLPALRCCPSSTFCQEVHRLTQQLVYDEVALTGMGFFTVNRNFMLGVAGAIATYEIVLLQLID